MSLGSGALITLAQAKQQLNKPDSDTADDAELEGYILAASEAVEDHLGYLAARRTVVEDQTLDGTGVVCLQASPIAQLVSVVALADDSDVTDAASVTDHQNGIVAIAASGTHRFTVVAGLPSTPWKVNLATRIVLDDLWESQRRLRSARSIDDPMEGPRRPGYAIPYQAMALLGGKGSNAP